MDKRTLLAIVLSLIIVMAYQYLFIKPVPKEQQPATSVQETEDGTQKIEEAPTETQLDETFRTPLVKKNDEKTIGEIVHVETPLYSAMLSTKGAALTSFKLRKYQKELESESGLIELVNLKEEMVSPLSITFPKSSIDVSPEVLYETDTVRVDLTEKLAEETIIFSKIYPGEIKIEKIFTFNSERYTFDLEVRVHNLSQERIKQNTLLSWKQYVDPEVKTNRYSHEGPVSYVKSKLDTEKTKKLDEPKVRGPDVSWAGFEKKYFVAAIIPQQPSLTNLIMSKDAQNLVSIDLEGPKNIILPGQFGTYGYTLYLGPKEYATLKAEGVGLENSINFGSWLKWLALPLLTALKYAYQYAQNYGMAIIILTLLIKIVLWPLGNISYKSMKEMQKLQPKIKEIQERHKDDKGKMNQEVMALYKTYKVNPMSGCLPILVQLPVFLGLYKALLYSIELRHAPFYLWIHDLSAKDPYYITPLVMGATMFLQQKMSPTPGGDQMQAKMMMWMPVIFTFMFLNFPSGLVIYWLFNNIISIGQQYYVNKRKS